MIGKTDMIKVVVVGVMVLMAIMVVAGEAMLIIHEHNQKVLENDKQEEASDDGRRGP